MWRYRYSSSNVSIRVKDVSNFGTQIFFYWNMIGNFRRSSKCHDSSSPKINIDDPYHNRSHVFFSWKSNSNSLVPKSYDFRISMSLSMFVIQDFPLEQERWIFGKVLSGETRDPVLRKKKILSEGALMDKHSYQVKQCSFTWSLPGNHMIFEHLDSMLDSSLIVTFLLFMRRST